MHTSVSKEVQWIDVIGRLYAGAGEACGSVGHSLEVYDIRGAASFSSCNTTSSSSKGLWGAGPVMSLPVPNRITCFQVSWMGVGTYHRTTAVTISWPGCWYQHHTAQGKHCAYVIWNCHVYHQAC